jgi:hypothetical protein
VGSRVVRTPITSPATWHVRAPAHDVMEHTDRPLVVRTRAKLSGVVGQLTGRAGEVAICMDFDGPIAPIVQDPAAARPLPGMVELLGRWPTATPPWP